LGNKYVRKEERVRDLSGVSFMGGGRGLKATENLPLYAFMPWRLVAKNNSCIDCTIT